MHFGLLFCCWHVRSNVGNVNYFSDRFYNFDSSTLQLRFCIISEHREKHSVKIGFETAPLTQVEHIKLKSYTGASCRFN